MKKEDLRNLFPWPDDASLPKVRFGVSPETAPRDLPPSGLSGGPIRFSTTSPAARFTMNWKDENLGLEVRIRQQENGEIWALVDSNDKDRAGQVVSVALIGPQDGQIKRLEIPLDKVKEMTQTRFGSALFGTVESLAEELGSPLGIDLVVCRLEYPAGQA